MEGHLRLSFAGTVKDVTRGRRAHQVGARSEFAQRNLHRRHANWSGTGYEQHTRYQDARAGRRPRRSRATTGWTTTASPTWAGSYWNLPTEALYEEIVFRREARITQRRRRSSVNTGKHTARSANDKFVVREPSTEEHIWWGEYNRPFSAGQVQRALHPACRDSCRDATCSSRTATPARTPNYRMPVRIVTELAWHSPVRPEHVHPAEDATRSTAATCRTSP